MEFLKNRWIEVSISLGLLIVIPGAILYYNFFFAPKSKVKAFFREVDSTYKTCQGDTAKLENYVVNWEEFSKGDLNKKQEELKIAKQDFTTLRDKLNSFKPVDEFAEAYKSLKGFSEKGITVSENLETIAFYFWKVEESVTAFNKLNTETANFEEIQTMVGSFKGISEKALGDLEQVSAPKSLLGIDKDFKDLLRQYIKSATDLTDALSKKDTKKIDSVGKESDQAVLDITKQLQEDIKSFKQSANLEQDVSILKGFQKTIDEDFGSLRSKWRIKS